VPLFDLASYHQGSFTSGFGVATGDAGSDAATGLDGLETLALAVGFATLVLSSTNNGNCNEVKDRKYNTHAME
jgi:hypothetical protein